MTLPTLDQLYVWAKDNQLMLGLLASAVIGSMPELLPNWRNSPQWAWTWIRDSAKTFLNFRNAAIHPPAVPPVPAAPVVPPPAQPDGPQQLNG
jgi:hypothetical protein